jgi:group I intron endonuclease
MATYQEKLKDPRWQNRSGIYQLVVNRKNYIGSAIDLPKRLRSHVNDLKANRHTNIHLQRAFNKFGIIDFDVLEIVENAQSLIKREQYFIDLLQPHYNISLIAGSQLGFKHSEKTKRLISQIQIGKKMSPESVALMAASKRGVKLSESHRKNIALSKTGDKNPFYRAGTNHPQYGTHKSEATKQKLSGDNNWASKSGVLYDVETGANYIFRSLRKVCSQLGLTYRSVLGAARANRFYLNRFHAAFVQIPKGHETLKINKINLKAQSDA